MTKLPTLEEMLKSGLHFGHRSSRWHPKMKPYIFTQRKGIHIINLSQTRDLLETALNFIAKLASEDKQILFVGTKDQVKKPLKEAAIAAGMPYVNEKWLGGTLTNFAIIKKSIKKYKDLIENKASGKLKKYTKKEQLEFDRDIEDLEVKVGGISSLVKMPDAIFIWDIKREATALKEAKNKKIPVIAVCDTNTNPAGIEYIIPANDDATQGLELILGLAKEAILDGKKNKKEAKKEVKK